MMLSAAKRSLVIAVIVTAIIPPLARAQETDLAVSKSGPETAAAGSDVSYSVTVSNFGSDDALSVTLTDPIPAGMAFVSSAQNSGPGFSCSTPAIGSGGTITCTIATLPVGISASFTFVFNINIETPPGTVFVNIATASTATPDVNAENDSGVAATSTPPPPQSDMLVSKSGPPGAGPDTDVVYTISVGKGGPDDGSSVTLQDTLPGTMTFVSLVQNSGPTMSCTTPAVGSGGTVTCSVASFAAGATATFTLTGHVPPGTPAGTEFTNTVTISASNDPNPENNVGTWSVVVSTADLSVTKSGPATAPAGTNITYTITVSNGGPDPGDNVILNDTLPPGTTFVSITQNSGPAASCTGGASVTCDFGTLASGASAQFTLVINAGSSPSITNTASVSTDSSDPGGANNSSSVTTTITPVADVAVSKSGPATVTAGSNVTYSVTVTNNGPSAAVSVSLTDAVPANTTFVSANQTSGPTFSCTTPAVGATGTITCNIASLASAASATFSFVFNVATTAAGSTTNIANVSTTTADPTPTNNSSSVITTITSAADVAVTKSGPPTVTAGSNVTYTVTVTNNGPSEAANVSLTDAVPADTTFVSANQTSGPAFSCTTPAVGASGTITCNIASLASAASATFSFVFNVATSATGSITNNANVTTTTTDPTPANNTATAITPIGLIMTDVGIAKTANSSLLGAGSTATFTIVVTNNGPNTAMGTTVTDVLPAGTTFNSASSTQGTCSGTSTVTCAIGTLAASGSATITIVVTLPMTAGPVSNTATVTISNADTNPANNSSTVIVTVFVGDIPALSPLALAILGFTLAAVALWVQRLR